MTNSLRLRSLDLRPGALRAPRRGLVGAVRDGAFLVGVAGIALALAGGVYAADRAIDAGAQRVVVTGRDIAFEPTEIRIDAGRWTVVEFTNTGAVFHDWEVEGVANVDAGARPGQTTRLRFVLDEPGSYTYLCTVPGHAEAGMTGTLVVE